MEQRSDEWFAARLGKVTASKVADVIAKTKTGYSASRDNYMAQLICERMTGQKQESFTNTAMEWGTATEPLARAAYEAHANVLVNEIGIIDHPFLPMCAASPDGLVDIDGMLEIKCPNTATHFDTLLSGFVPAKYIPQMQWQMACAGYDFVDFISYNPNFPDHLQLFVKRLDRDNNYIRELETEVSAFIAEIEQQILKLKEL